MDQYSLAQEFVDLMAKALQILVQASERDLYALDAMKASTAIGNDVKQKIDAPTITKVGGCSYAGIDCPNRFGTMAKCNFHCGTSSVCFFVVNIPTAVSQGKISPGSIPKIEHINN